MTVRPVRTRLTGTREMERVLKGLPQKVRGKVLASAARAGAQVVRKEAELRLGGEKGDIIVRKVGTRDKRKPTFKGGVTIRVGPPKDKFFLLFREFGSAAHAIVSRRRRGSTVLAEAPGGEVFGPTVQHPGQPPRPFLRPAFDQTKGKALAAIGKSMGRGIEREATKLAGSFAKSGLKARRRRRRR